MQEAFGCHFCSLHVRYTNMAAFHLYSQTLGYKIDSIEKGYYADGEDAYSMKVTFVTNEKKKKKVVAVGASTAAPSSGPVVEAPASNDVKSDADEGVSVPEQAMANLSIDNTANS